MISALVNFCRRPTPPQLNFSLSQSIGLVFPTEIPGSAASLGYEWISVNQNPHCIGYYLSRSSDIVGFFRSDFSFLVPVSIG